MGTLVRDDATGVRLADLIEDGQEYVVAKGGRGGKGNACYATSTNRALLLPKKANPVKTAGLSWSLTSGGCRACRLSQRRQIKHYCAGIGSKAGNCGLPFYYADPGAWCGAYRRRTQLCAGRYSGPY